MTQLFPELAAAILDLCRDKGLHVATAESCTGGLVCAALTAIAGSSDVVECGYITYSYAAKTAMLGLAAEQLRDFGAVSEPVASAMAEGALARSAADLAVAVTGVAGPGASEAKPEGMVCFALARRGHQTLTLTRQYGAIGRTEIRSAAVEQALLLLRDAALAAPKK